MDDALHIFEAERAHLIALAYRMLGERSGAEDVVQEAWLRWQQSDRSNIKVPAAWLRRVTARLAIDALRQAQRRRETYVGPWLPEPLVADETGSVEADFLLAEECRLALLWAMDRLDPVERAGLILRDVFDADYADLAETLGKSEAACRQLVSRARKRVRNSGPRFDASAQQVNDLIARFSNALAARDFDAVKALFAPDAVAISDGGRSARAARRVLAGPDEIAQVSLAVFEKFAKGSWTPRLARANGLPVLMNVKNARPDSVLTLLPDRMGRIAWLYTMRAPEKLAHVA